MFLNDNNVYLIHQSVDMKDHLLAFLELIGAELYWANGTLIEKQYFPQY